MGNKPMAYKISEPTYKLPGEGSRENYSEGTFKEDNRAMQAGLIVNGGFGDLSDSYKGTSESPTLQVELGTNTLAAVETIGAAGEASEGMGEGGGSDSTVADMNKRRHEREQANNEKLAERVSTKDIAGNLSKRDLV